MSVGESIFADADHRLAALPVQAAIQHLGDIEDVVAGLDRTPRTASQPCQSIGQLRQAMAVFQHGKSGKRIPVATRCEIGEHFFVLCPENVDRKHGATLEQLPQETITAQGDGNHGRLEPGLFDEAAEHADPAPLVDSPDNVKSAGDTAQRGFETLGSLWIRHDAD